MEEKTQIFKCRRKGLYFLLEERLLQLQEKSYDIISWDKLYCKLGRGFSIKKQQVREILYFLAEFGLIEIHKRGIKLNFRVENET